MSFETPPTEKTPPIEQKELPNDIAQKNMPQYLEEYGVSDPDSIAKLSMEITDIIYDRNNLTTKFEEEDDEDRRRQIFNDIEEIEAKIKEMIENFEK